MCGNSALPRQPLYRLPVNRQEFRRPFAINVRFEWAVRAGVTGHGWVDIASSLSVPRGVFVFARWFVQEVVESTKSRTVSRATKRRPSPLIRSGIVSLEAARSFDAI